MHEKGNMQKEVTTESIHRMKGVADDRHSSKEISPCNVDRIVPMFEELILQGREKLAQSS